MPEVKLNTADAAELAEMLEFLSEWLAPEGERDDKREQAENCRRERESGRRAAA